MRREELYLRDIIESIAAIETFLHDIEKSEFLVNELIQSAVLYKLMIIGEAAAHIPEDLRTRYTETPWKKIIGLRNIAAHSYFSIDWEAIWATATKRLAPLRDEIVKILKDNFPDSDFESED